MKKQDKQALYENIMLNVSKLIKKALTEAEELETPPAEINLDVDDIEDLDEVEVFVPDYGNCTVKACFDADNEGDFYEVTDEDGEHVCDLPYSTDLSDEDSLIDAIQDLADFESGSGDYENTDPLGYWDGSDDEDDEMFDDEDDEDDLDEAFGYDDDDDIEYDDNSSDKYCLVGIDGNAFSVMGYVAKAMRHEGMTQDEVAAYRQEAMSGDYSNLLCVSQEMIDKLNKM